MTSHLPTGINQPSPSVIQHMEAFAATQAARDALRSEDLIQVFADVHTAASRAVAGAERAEPFAKQIEALPTGKDLLRDVKRYALAAAHAQYLFFTTVMPPAEVDAMVEQLREIRDVLYADASTLVKRKLIAKEAIAHFTNSPGHRAITYDVILLSIALRNAWPQIEGKSAVTMQELDAAFQLAEKAGAIITLKEMGERTQVETKDQRNRAFTLMAASHDELRRALGYVRYHEQDADEIAPSLAAQRGKGRRKEDEEEDPPAAPPGVGPVASPAGNTPVAPSSNGASAAAPSIPGVPSASPFIK